MLHVYLIPAKRSNGYCFEGPVPITFGNVDWMGDPPESMTLEETKNFIAEKRYVKNSPKGTRFLVLCDLRPELTFQIVNEAEGHTQ